MAEWYHDAFLPSSSKVNKIFRISMKYFDSHPDPIRDPDAPRQSRRINLEKPEGLCYNVIAVQAARIKELWKK